MKRKGNEREKKRKRKKLDLQGVRHPPGIALRRPSHTS
jgi:hypothetical protein